MIIFEAGNDVTVPLAVDQRLIVRGTLNDVYAVSGLGLSAGLIATTRLETTFGPYPVAGVIRLHAREHRGSYGITDSSDTKLYVSASSPSNSDGRPEGAVVLSLDGGINEKVGGRYFRSPGSSADLRQVSNNCRYPNITAGLRQYFGYSMHVAGEDIDWLRIGFANYYGAQEIQGASTLQIACGIEYPIGRNDLQMVRSLGEEFGQASPGADLLFDGLQLDTIIPKGARFKIYTYVYSTASGIPVSYCGPQPFTNGTNDYGLAVQSGANTTAIEYFFTKPNAVDRAALANTSGNSNIQLTPICILSNKGNRALGLLGDSRGAGQSAQAPWNFDYVSDTSLQQCTLERVYGDLAPWINLAASADLASQFTTSGGARRSRYLKYVTDIVNGYGTNDAGPAADAATLIAIDTTLANLRYIKGKRLYGMTIPPSSTSTNQFIDQAGQTLAASDAKRLALNAYRLGLPAIYTGGVLDFASIVTDGATGKWKGAGRAFTGTCTAASATVTASASVFVPSDTGKTVFVTNGGSGQNLVATANYVNATTITLTDKVTGLPLNASTSQAAVVSYIDCRAYTSDGIHETQFAAQLYGTGLKAQALTNFNS